MGFGSLRLTICVLFLWLAGTLALDIQGHITWNDVCSNASALGRAKAVLDSGIHYSGSVTTSGSFSIPDVPVGTYIFSVITHDYVFDQLRIDVLNSSGPEPEVRPYIPGTPLNPPAGILLPYPIILQAKHKFVYFSPPESFNIFSMLSNPMTLMMVFAGIMMLATPYLMKNLDPEALEEFKEQQVRVAGAQSALASGDIKSGISAIMAAAEESRGTTQEKVPHRPSKGSRKSKR